MRLLHRISPEENSGTIWVNPHLANTADILIAAEILSGGCCRSGRLRGDRRHSKHAITGVLGRLLMAGDQISQGTSSYLSPDQVADSGNRTNRLPSAGAVRHRCVASPTPPPRPAGKDYKEGDGGIDSGSAEAGSKTGEEAQSGEQGLVSVMTIFRSNRPN